MAPAGARAKPAVFLFDCRAEDDGGLRLHLEEAQGAAGRYFMLPEGTQPRGKSARELFPFDTSLVDSWMEFLLKMRKNPQEDIYDERDGDSVTKHTLQYLQVIKDWVLIDLTYRPASGKAEMVFSEMRDEAVLLRRGHLFDLKQKMWLQDYVSSDGYWEIDLPSGEILLSRSVARALKIAEDTVIVPVDRFLSKVHPEDVPQVDYALKYVEKERKIIKNRGVLDDGSMVYFKSYGIPGYNDEGVMTRIIGHSQDETEAGETGARLAMSEKRFRGIVENSQDVFFVLGTDGVVNYVSPRVQAVSGHTQTAVVGRRLQDFVAYRDEQQALEADLARVASEGANTKGEYLINCADGRLLWMLVRMSAVLDEDGRVAEVVAVCRDVSEEKKREENLRHMSTHDALTGVYNRYHFENEMERLERERAGQVGIIVADLNGLKLVNDGYGHQRGDALLCEAARLIQGLCKPNHTLCRTGGGEFVILAQDTTEEELRTLCDEMGELCNASMLRAIPISLSWGLAWRQGDEPAMQALQNQAENSMYANKLLDSRSTRSHMLASLKETLRSRNLETADHTQRMEKMVSAVGRRLGLSSSEFDRLVLLASMHDIGKVAIPDSVINKPGRLTEEEWAIMRTHSEIGARIAATAQELSVIEGEIACHHERWDGTGYPFAKSGEDIPLLSRIITVVDSYDVMTHKRVYKEAMSHKAAVEELRRCSGTQFDPHIVDLFLEIFGEMGAATPA